MRATCWNIFLKLMLRGRYMKLWQLCFLCLHLQASSLEDKSWYERQGHTQPHRKHFFRWCFSVTFASPHLHKWSTVVPSLYFNMQFDATPSMLHENEFIYVYRGSNILWPLKVGNVAYIRDLSEYTDLSIRQCAHTHTGWLMGLTLCQSDPV